MTCKLTLTILLTFSVANLWPMTAIAKDIFRVAILRHPDHVQAQTMFTKAIEYINNLRGTVGLSPVFVNVSQTGNTPVGEAMFHEANDLCYRLCGNAGDYGDGIVALLTAAPHWLAFRIASGLELPVFSASTVPPAIAPNAWMAKPVFPVNSTIGKNLVRVSTQDTTFATKATTPSGTVTTPTPVKSSPSIGAIHYAGPDHILPMYSFIIRQHWFTFVYVADGKEALERYMLLRARLDDLSRDVSRFKIYLICFDQVNQPPPLFHSTRYLPSLDSMFVDRFILDMPTTKKYEMMLTELRDLGMMSAPYRYYIVKHAISELNLIGFEKGGATIYGYRTTADDTRFFWDITQSPAFQTNTLQVSGNPSVTITEAEALVFDLVYYVKSLLEALISNTTVKETLSKPYMQVPPSCGDGLVPVSCQHSILQRLAAAQGLKNFISKHEAQGLTGTTSFDKLGRRRGHALYLMKMSQDKPLQIKSVLLDNGKWIGDGKRQRTQSQSIITLNVTTIDSPPFVFWQNASFGKSQQTTPAPGLESKYVINYGEFEGFCVDLANEIGKLLNIRFRFHHVNDGKYGAENPRTKQWDGMIGEVIRKEADLALAPLTITSARERVVYMTKPILNTGISIMIRKPNKQHPGVFSFLEPLSSAIWVCTLFAYCGTSVCMWILCRLNNGEMVTPFRNSFWSALCALLGLGGEFSPKTCSGRLLACVWYFFCLILISSYTANMTAFLTIERLVVPIESAEELLNQNRIQYGTLASGSTKGFFETSDNPLYQEMWEVMNRTRPTVFVQNVKEGVKRVQDSAGTYAFFLESVMNAYYNQRRPCDTVQVGPLLDSKGYGIATPVGSPHHANLNYAVLYLKEMGVVQQLVTKWWYDKGECPEDVSNKQDVSGPLKLNSVTGVFFILVGGLVIGICSSLLEFAIAAAGLSRRTKTTFPTAARELLSGCILGSASKTIRPLQSLENLARVLPWVEMPNFSARMLLNRLDAISPNDPRQKYVTAACLQRFCKNSEDLRTTNGNGIIRDGTALTQLSGSNSAESRPTAILPPDAIMSQSQANLYSPSRPNGIVLPENQPLSMCRSQTHPQSFSQPLPLVTDLDASSDNSFSTSNSLSSAAIDDGGCSSEVRLRRPCFLPQFAEEDGDKTLTKFRRPGHDHFQSSEVAMPETLHLRPKLQISARRVTHEHDTQQQPTVGGNVSLYEMLTTPGLASAAAVQMAKIVPGLSSDDVEEDSLQQQRWYQYHDNDLSNL